MAVATTALLTVADAARTLGVSDQTIYRLIGSGELRALRVGFGPRAQYRIDPEELAATIARASAR